MLVTQDISFHHFPETTVQKLRNTESFTNYFSLHFKKEMKLKKCNSLFEVIDIFCRSVPWFNFIKDKTQVTSALGDKYLGR